MGAPEHRYTDADVRGDETLVELAYEYLDCYSGDFEPLVEAQDIIARGYLLTTPIARKVLNCMRNNMYWAHRLPRPGNGSVQQSGPRLKLVTNSGSRLADEPPPERPLWITTVANVHYEFGCPRSRGNLHIVDMARMKWYLPWSPFDRWQHLQVGQRVPHLEVRWLCGKATEEPRLSDDDTCLSDYFVAVCRKCFGDG